MTSSETRHRYYLASQRAGSDFSPHPMFPASCRQKHMTNPNRLAFAAAILLLSLSATGIASAGGSKRQVCDVRADYALGVEDYTEAIRLHTRILRKYPDDALAHYHLGFAQGMIGNRMAEDREYQRAAELGLRYWDLFLNMGLAQLENDQLDAATQSLRQAVLLGADHFESHFNLALVYAQRGLLADAERETLASLRLNPRQPDALNSLGVIYAEEGQTDRAAIVWRELLREVPNYEAARTNLALLGRSSGVAIGGRAAIPPPTGAVKAIEDRGNRPTLLNETEFIMVPSQQSGR